MQNAGVLYILTCKCAWRHSGVPFLEIWRSKDAPSMPCFSILTFKCASRYSGVQIFHSPTSKNAPTLRCFVHFDLQMCFAPLRRAIFWHLNFQNWVWTVSGLAFWLANVLRATAACHSSTSELPKVSGDRQCFSILTCKCASRHSGVPFFDIATAKSGPNPSDFVHFDLKMCFAPQRRAIFLVCPEQLPPHPPL